MAGIGAREMRNLKVAAVQLGAKPCRVRENNERAEPLIERAAREGARLVVLPETYSSGYLATSEIWAAAERRDGLTSEWLRGMSSRLGIYLGTGFVETDGRDFFNAYMLAGPDGRIAGLCRKRNAEGYAFKRGDGPHVFDTELGRIGIGICADNQFAFLPALMSASSADIVLMPHAAPLRERASRESVGDSEYAKIEAQYERMAELPRRYAGMLGVPVVFATQVGKLERMPGIIGKAMNPETWRIPGISRIVDSDCSTKAELGDAEGVAIADISLDPRRKAAARESFDSRSGLDGFSAFARRVIFPIDGFFARRSYDRDRASRSADPKRAKTG